jgi:hypothetical protein
MLSLGRLHLFRSRVLSTLAAVLVLLGSAAILNGACCSGADRGAGCNARDTSHSSEQKADGDCVCLCHQASAEEQVFDSFLRFCFRQTEIAFADVAGFPPDAIPFGIDHPPQLS